MPAPDEIFPEGDKGINAQIVPLVAADILPSLSTRMFHFTLRACLTAVRTRGAVTLHYNRNVLAEFP